MYMHMYRYICIHIFMFICICIHIYISLSATQMNSEFQVFPKHFNRLRGLSSLSGGAVPCASQFVVFALAIDPPSPSPAGFSARGWPGSLCEPICRDCVASLCGPFCRVCLAIAPPSPTPVGFRGVRAGGVAGGPDMARGGESQCFPQFF